MRASGFGELCVVLALLPGCLWAKEVRCPCIADTLMGGHRSEVTHNFGGSDYLRLKGRQGVGFLKFDMGPARGMEVAGAMSLLSK